ncbi:MAG: phage holin family protein [Myxococcota bacterium]|nr:phage holin family protein [Myxococcota bacterium]
MMVAKSDPSVGELLGALARDTGVLVRQEVQLASNEMTQKIATAARSVGLIAAGGALVHAGLLALIGALCVGLVTMMMIPVWLSALVVGLAIAGIGYALVQMGLNSLKRLNPVPQQTVRTLKDDAVGAKEQLR